MTARFAHPDILSPSPHHLHQVPVLVLMPHSKCNCRCLMCDIWKGNKSGTSLSLAQLQRIEADLRAFGVKHVVLSGGEALMHPDIWSLCALLKSLPARVTLLSTGQTLAHHVETVSVLCDEVIVSLDGSPAMHDVVRGIPGAFEKLQDGIVALRRHRPDFPIAARCVLQKCNFRDLTAIVTAARSLNLDRISFLAADLSTTAFNRPNGWDDKHTDAVCLSVEESLEFADIIEQLIADNADDFATGFITERPERLRGLAHYYQAVHGLRSFPPIRCKAPWVSTVIEADGTVRPCFFHPALGNVNDRPLNTILNSDEAIAFRETLDVRSNPICQRCVCTFNM